MQLSMFYAHYHILLDYIEDWEVFMISDNIACDVYNLMGCHGNKLTPSRPEQYCIARQIDGNYYEECGKGSPSVNLRSTNH